MAELDRELKNLETGVHVEISEEVQAVFDRLNLKVQTGVQWLRKSAMKPDKKAQMIEKHPFFPFALILDEKDSGKLIEELQKQSLYVSSPFIFCSREMLSKKESALIDHLSFYLHFNKNLIFPDQLEKLIEQTKEERGRQARIRTLQREQLDHARSEKSSFDQDNLKRSDLEQAQSALDTIQNTIDTLIRERNDALCRQDECLKQKSALEGPIKKLTKTLAVQTERESKWASLIVEFNRALSEQKELEQTQENLESARKDLKQTDVLLTALEEKRIQANRDLLEANSAKEQAQKRTDSFESFGPYQPASGTLEDLSARFDSLSQKLSASQFSVYQTEYENASKSAANAKKRLERVLARYQFEDDSWKNVVFSQEAVFENEARQDTLGKEQTALQNERTSLSSQIARLQGLKEANEKNMMDLVLTSTPLEKSQCRQMDLGAEKKRLEAQLTDVSKSRTELLQKAGKFGQTGQRLLRVSLFAQAEADQDLTKWTPKKVDESASALILDLDNQNREIGSQTKSLDSRLSRTIEEYRSRQQICFDVLRSIQSLLETPKKLPQEIEQKQMLLQNLIEKTQADLHILKDNHRHLTQMLLDYVQNLHTQFGCIDQDTTITISGNSRKMLSIEMKDWEEIEPVARVRLESFLNELITRIEKQPDQEEMLIQQEIQPARLYDYLAEINRIAIKLYKIEEDRQTRISWNQAGRMSGAEGFLCAFVVVSAVLNFQRKDAVSRIYGRKAAHTMILDNPFAYVQSGHIIQALMSLCETTATQLVAFSNVGNADVINAFKNIYSLRLIPRFDDKNHLAAEHEKSSAEGRVIDSIRIQLRDLEEEQEMEESEQISLF